jgi:hypothetical protein
VRGQVLQGGLAGGGSLQQHVNGHTAANARFAQTLHLALSPASQVHQLLSIYSYVKNYRVAVHTAQYRHDGRDIPVRRIQRIQA